MNYENKYKEALERARKLYEQGTITESLCYVFPELAESEDERIRKSLLEYLHTLPNHYAHSGVCAPEWIAWLEKQGEQKLYVNDNAKEMFIKALECVEEQNNKGYKLTDCDKNSWWEDFKAYTSCIVEQKPWSEEDEMILSDIIKDLVHPWNEYIPYRIEDEIKWLKNKLKTIKDRVQPQPKPEWSEEDETVRNNIIAKLAILKSRAVDGGAEKEICEMEINWLKSLKDRYTWKPSDEQMLALEAKLTIPPQSPAMTSALIELYEQLKKLREGKL